MRINCEYGNVSHLSHLIVKALSFYAALMVPICEGPPALSLSTGPRLCQKKRSRSDRQKLHTRRGLKGSCFHQGRDINTDPII